MKSKIQLLKSSQSTKPAITETGSPVNTGISVDLTEMLTAKELEALLKIDQKTIYRYVACGLIPYVRIQSNIRFIKWQIAKWIEEQTYLPKTFNKE
jgi:predicted DNA-binding transcriptional regulator AlpA